MVVANDDIPCPTRKRPRLSLKSTFRKTGEVPVVPPGERQGTTPQDITKETISDPSTATTVDLTTEDLADDSVSFAPKEGPTVPPVSSLQNIGNTCFLNSVLQVLRYTPGFLDGLGELFREIIAVEETRKAHMNKNRVNNKDDADTSLPWELVKHLFKLYKNMEKREKRYFEIASADITSMAVKPDQVLDIIRLFNPMFEGNLQHDAQELLRCLLCYLEDAENELHKAQLDLIAKIPPKHTTQDAIFNPIMQKFLQAGKKSSRASATVTKAHSLDRGKTKNKKNYLSKKVDFDEVDGVCAANNDGNRIRDEVCLQSDEAEAEIQSSSSRTLRTRMINRKKTSTSSDSIARTMSSSSFHEQTDKRKCTNLVLTKSASENCLVANCRPQASIKNLFKRETKCGKRLGVRGRVSRKTEETLSNGPIREESEENRCTVDREISFRLSPVKGVSSPYKLDTAFSSMSCTSPRQLNPRGDTATTLSTIKRENSCHSVSVLEGNKIQSPTKRKVDFDMMDSTSSKSAKMTSVEERSPGKSNGISFGSNYKSPTKSPKRSDAGSPKKVTVLLENCDHVCDSPLKTVLATEAMETLSCVKRKVNFDCDVIDSSSNSSVDTYAQDSDNDSSEGYLKTVPVKPLSVKVENCDSICGTSKKSVSATYAMKYLAGNKMPKIDFVERLFQGSMMLRTRCLECEFSREKTEVFQDVSVPLRAEKEDDDSSDDSDSDESCLSKLMSAFTEIERLRDDNKYFCDHCLCYVEAERSLHYDVLPSILTLHLKRFSTSAGMFGSHCVSKINDHVTIPLALPCLRYKCPKPCCRPDHRYTLFGIVTHAGMTISSGHYLSYVKVDTNCGQIASYTPSQAEGSKIRPENTGSSVGDNSVAGKDNSDEDDSSTAAMPNVEWLECDDECIRVHSDEEFHNYLSGKDGALLGSPYVLFYRRVTVDMLD